MATQEQYSPFIEEGHEENKRLYDKDKKHSFVPIEEVPDDALLPDQFEDREKIGESDSEHEHAEPAHEEKIETLKKEIKLGYARGDSVASVGPDVIEDVPDAIEAELDPVLPGIDDVAGALHEKVSSLTAESNPYMRHQRNGPKRSENLKTLTASKKERSARSWLSRLLTGEKKTKEKQLEERLDALDEEILDSHDSSFES